MHPTLELQHTVGRLPRLGVARCTHGQGGGLVAAEVCGLGVEQLGLPAASFAVPQVHVEQVAGEERRLLAPLPRLDLHQRVTVVVRVARGEQRGELVANQVQASRYLGLLRCEVGVLGGEFRGRLRVVGQLVEFVEGLDDLAEFGVSAARRAGARDVRQHGRVGHQGCQLRVLGAHALGSLEHRSSLVRPAVGNENRRWSRITPLPAPVHFGYFFFWSPPLLP